MGTRLERRVVNKTVDYTISPVSDRPGTLFTNEGASALVTFTLPQPTRATLGWWYRFKTLHTQNVQVAAPVAGTLITHGNAAADSVQTAGTPPAMIGAEIEAACVETTPGVYRWSAGGITAGHTYTVA